MTKQSSVYTYWQVFYSLSDFFILTYIGPTTTHNSNVYIVYVGLPEFLPPDMLKNE